MSRVNVDSVSMPLLMKIGMWFAVVFVIGTTALLMSALFGVGVFRIGGQVVDRQVWLRVASPLLLSTNVLMGIIAYGFYREKSWSRHIAMLMWGSIGLYALVSLAIGVNDVPRALLWRALVESIVFGVAAGWYFYWKRNVVEYFRTLARRER